MDKRQKEIVKKYLKLAKKLKRKPSLTELGQVGVTERSIRTRFGKKSTFDSYVEKAFKAEFKNISKKSTSQAILEQERLKEQSRIIDVYCSQIEAKNFFPKLEKLKDLGVSRQNIITYFKSLAGLRAAAKKAKPQLFKGVLELNEYLTDENAERIQQVIDTHKTFFITTAVSGQAVNQEFLKSIKTFCKKNDACLLLLPAHDPAHNLNNQVEWHFDDTLTKTGTPFIFEEMNLNDNIIISGIRVTAKQINPMTGLGRITKGTRSFIFASPKQSLEFVSNSNKKIPHAMMSTGACTLPNYATSRGNSLRLAYLAELDHIVGGIIVEIEDNKTYHFRQVQADSQGSFVDLGIKYSEKGTEKVSGTVLVMGDLHAQNIDEVAFNATLEMVDSLKVKTAVIHDWFDGESINHHEENDLIKRAIKAEQGLLSVEKELIFTAKLGERILEKPTIEKVLVVQSNHNDFVNRWLKRGAFFKEPHNYKIGCILSQAYIEGKDPFRAGVELLAPTKYPQKLEWLEADQDYVVYGTNLGYHGDKGPKGARGSLASLEASLVNAVIAHSHGPGILRKTFQVGTLSKLQLGYNSGPSNWMHTNCLVYPNGTKQLVNIISGKWRLKKIKK